MQPPIVDISGLVDGQPGALERVARALREPAADWGAFHVVGHGIAQTQLARFDSAMRAFFALPREAKRRTRRTRDNARGFYDEELTKNRPDWKEVFDYGAECEPAAQASQHSDGVNQWPEALPGFREALLAHYGACERVGLALLRALCVSLGLPPDILREAFAEHSSFVRLNCYRPSPNPAPPDAPLFPEDAQLGVHHHTDAGGLTLVYQDDVGGLQLWYDDAFRLIEPVDDALLVHMADMLQVWSNDRFCSPLHRALTHGDRTRYSAPFFLNPGYTATCEPLRSLLRAGERAHYRPVSWRHFRDQRSAGDYADYGEEIQIAHFRSSDSSERVTESH